MRRINKKQARNEYNNGNVIYMLPVNIRENSRSWPAAEVKKRADSDTAFDTIVHLFEFYNCNYETGYYAKYFIKD